MYIQFQHPVSRGATGNFERGRRYICNRRDEIIVKHGLSRIVKCVAPPLADMSLTKYEMMEGARAPLPVAPLPVSL